MTDDGELAPGVAPTIYRLGYAAGERRGYFLGYADGQADTIEFGEPDGYQLPVKAAGPCRPDPRRWPALRGGRR